MKSSLFVKATTACAVASTLTFLPSVLDQSSAATKVKNGTFLGTSAMTQFGPVQVKVVIAGGKITKVTVPVYPTNTPRDQQINSQAIPMLVQEVLKVQSSKIYGISGASYTSQGFYDSLVSALAKSGHA